MDMNQIPKAGFQYGKVANHTETASETAKKIDTIGIWLFSQPRTLSITITENFKFSLRMKACVESARTLSQSVN